MNSLVLLMLAFELQDNNLALWQVAVIAVGVVLGLVVAIVGSLKRAKVRKANQEAQINYG